MNRSTPSIRHRVLAVCAATALALTTACSGDDDGDGDSTATPTPSETAETTEAPEPTEDPVAFGETATLPNGLSITPSALSETDDEPDLNFPEDTEGPYFVFEVEFANQGDEPVDLRTLRLLPQPDNGRGTVHIDLTGITDPLEPGGSLTVPAALHSLENTDTIELAVSDADETATVVFRD